MSRDLNRARPGFEPGATPRGGALPLSYRAAGPPWPDLDQRLSHRHGLAPDWDRLYVDQTAARRGFEPLSDREIPQLQPGGLFPSTAPACQRCASRTGCSQCQRSALRAVTRRWMTPVAPCGFEPLTVPVSEIQPESSFRNLYPVGARTPGAVHPRPLKVRRTGGGLFRSGENLRSGTRCRSVIRIESRNLADLSILFAG